MAHRSRVSIAHPSSVRHAALIEVVQGLGFEVVSESSRDVSLAIMDAQGFSGGAREAPVIVVDAPAGEEGRLYGLGAAEVVGTDVSPEVFRAKIAVFMRLVEATRQRTLSLALSAEIGSCLVKSKGMRTVLQECAEAIHRNLDAAFARVWLLNDATQTLELEASAGQYTHLDGPHARVPVGKFKIGRIAQNRLPHLTNDVLHDPDVGDPGWARREGMVSFAGYPLQLGTRVVGVMAVFSRHTLPEETLIALASVADVMATGVRRRRVEEELVASAKREQHARDDAEHQRQRLLDVITQAPIGIAVMRGPEHRFETANVRYTEVAGRDPTGKTVREAFPELAGQHIYELLDHVYATGERFLAKGLSLHIVRPDVSADRPAYFDLIYEALREPDGRVGGIMVLASDVTDQERARQKLEALAQSLRESELQLRLLAEAIPQQVWTAGADGRLEFVNGRTTAYFGLSAEQILGSGWGSVLHPDDVSIVGARWMQSLSSGDPYEVEFRLRAADGGYRWHLALALAMRDEHGKILRWFGSNTDIHDRKRTEQERERLIHALEQSNQELDQFAYVASHDLKAPLRGISNLSRWIEDDLGPAMTETSRQQMALLRGRVERMDGLINGILNYSRAGRAQTEIEQVDSGALVLEVVELLAPPPGVRVEVDKSLPTVTSERVPLQQLFMNLIQNALKYGCRPDLVISVRGRDLGDRVEFTVADNGPGIDPKYHERIWGIFQTLAARDDVEGTGIGLSVVKKIVEGRGGRAWVESQPGAGATFHFTWPKTQTRSAP